MLLRRCSRSPLPSKAHPPIALDQPNTYIRRLRVLRARSPRLHALRNLQTRIDAAALSASSETIWDLKNYDRRPWGWTSADAAGLPIFPGLVRYDEAASGAINHAIRFTMQQTKNDANGGYFRRASPAMLRGTTYGASNIMGMRIRLEGSLCISVSQPPTRLHSHRDEKIQSMILAVATASHLQGSARPPLE